MGRKALAGIKVALGLMLGLMLAELAFWVRDGGAFPHVNFYQRDARLGVRLLPNAHMRIAFGGNAPSEIHTNSRGYRGRDWAAPAPNDLLVVGDSQVFGLGVNDGETFSAKLEAVLGGGAHVLNAGVPTYGPDEYTALVERLVKERKPEAVVYVLNMSNDLFELQHPNVERHVVWDGWAVRKETAPASVIEFPLRSWLMSQSHLIYALRRWWHAPAGNDAGFSSEGTWNELASTARKAAREPGVQPGLFDARTQLSVQLARSNERLVQRFASGVRADDSRFQETVRGLAGYRGDPRDILISRYAESARSVRETASQLLRASVALDQNDEALRALALRTNDAELTAALDERSGLRAQLAAQNAAVGEHEPSSNLLGAVLARTQRACEAAGARLLVVALPLDVQVSSSEWKKYGQKPIDLAPTRALNEDVVRRAHEVGARGLDATSALAAAEPGAFLNGDLHMSRKGHAALAHAIAAALKAAAEPGLPAVPIGRSLLPLPDEFARVGALPEPALASEHCALKSVREWIELRCGSDDFFDRPDGFTLLSGGRSDALASVGEDRPLIAILPLLEGDELHALVHSGDAARALHVRRARGGGLNVSLEPAKQAASPAGVVPEQIAVSFAGSTGYYDATCVKKRNWANTEMCLLGTGAMQCSEDQVQFGLLRRCVQRCSRSAPCKRGRCVLLAGVRGCVEP